MASRHRARLLGGTRPPYLAHAPTLGACAIAIAGLCSGAPCRCADALLAGFESPPVSARPLVWWHWMNGNVSAAGVKLDLEWMHRVGIGGAQLFQIDLGTPLMVAHRLD